MLVTDRVAFYFESSFLEATFDVAIDFFAYFSGSELSVEIGGSQSQALSIGPSSESFNLIVTGATTSIPLIQRAPCGQDQSSLVFKHESSCCEVSDCFEIDSPHPFCASLAEMEKEYVCFPS